MKRFLFVFLCLALLLGCAAPAFAAYPDLVVTQDLTIDPQFAKYGNITVKSGATLTIRRTAGFEIMGALTVEPGAALISDGEPPGMFNFAMGRDASISGIPLYYVSRNDGLVREIRGGWDHIASDAWNRDEWGAAFRWNTEVQGWCLNGTLQDDWAGYPLCHSERDHDVAERMAMRLKELGLFRGTGTNPDGSPRFELYRRGTRIEALIMLIRLLGKEDEALSGAWSHPFTDVPAWAGADQYVGYAYETGLTKGVSATRFGASDDASMQMYLTFLLRALGQTGDDVWPEAFERADEAGLTVKENDPYELCDFNFWRCDMVVASFRALEARCTDGRTLAKKLIAEGVFTDGQYNDARFW